MQDVGNKTQLLVLMLLLGARRVVVVGLLGVSEAPMLERTRYVGYVVRIAREQLIVVVGVLAPQVVYEVGGDVVARVVGYHAYHEDAVLLEVDVKEVLEAILAHLDRLVDEIDAFGYPLVGLARHRARYPHEHLGYVPEQHEHVPEPDDDEYLLVEQVDRQHALHRVLVALVRIADLADHEVAQCHLCTRIKKIVFVNGVVEMKCNISIYNDEKKKKHALGKYFGLEPVQLSPLKNFSRKP